MSLENISGFLNAVHETELAKKVLHVFGKHAVNFNQFDDVSKSFFKIKDYDNAILYGEKAHELAQTPEEQYVIKHNLINVYNHNNLPEKALLYIALNEQIKEIDNDRDFEKSFALFLLNNKSEAANILKNKQLDPQLSEMQRIKLEFNLGTYDLIEGNLQQGLYRFLIIGEKMGVHKSQDTHNLPRWNGIIKPGLKLLVMAEAGIGDEIINVRFIQHLKEYGIDPIWLTFSYRQDLVDIYQLNNITAYADITQIPNDFLTNCYYIPAMQLPVHLNCQYEDLWSNSYLPNLPAKFNNRWAETLTSSSLKIGLRWQGNPLYDHDLHRSIPLNQLINYVIIPDISTKLFSIQRDTGLDELNGFPDIEDLSVYLPTLPDLFACINNLDLIITSCTSIAHIAGALGKEVCVIVPISCYYVWCNPTKKSPWYGDNVHVFYQQYPRSWDEPLKELANYLKTTYKKKPG